MLPEMDIDLLFDPFGVRVEDILRAAAAAEQAGFSGVWLYDHLAGSVHRQDRVVECWTTLTAIAATVPRIMVGPLVLNVANRPAGTLAVMAATLQELSGGRLLNQEGQISLQGVERKLVGMIVGTGKEALAPTPTGKPSGRG